MAQHEADTSTVPARERRAQTRRAFLRGLAAAPQRFPVPVAGIVLLSLVANAEIQIESRWEMLFDLMLSLSGAVAASVAATLQGERAGRRDAVRHGVAAAAMAIVGAGIWFGIALNPYVPYALLLASLLTIPLAPYIGDERGAGFWGFQWRLAAAGLIGLLASLLVMVGLLSIVATLDYLFGIETPRQVSGHIVATSFALIGPLFVLGYVPSPLPRTDPTGDMRPVPGLQVMTDFVAVPLIVVYALVLHVYALKIAITGIVPDNEIGRLVLLFSLSIVGLRVILPPGAVFSGLPGRLFASFWPGLLVVPLGLLALAVALRIQAHGVTPPRYGLGLFAGVVALMMLAHLVPRLRGDLRLISGLAAIAMLAASIGPWGVTAVTVDSQLSRLEKLLTDAEILRNGRVVEGPPLPQRDRDAVRSVLVMLADNRGLDRVRPWLEGQPDDPFATADAGLRPSSRSAERVARLDLLGRVEFALTGASDALSGETLAPLRQYELTSGTAVVPMDVYDVLVANLPWQGAGQRTITAGSLSLTVTTESDRISLAPLGGDAISFSMQDRLPPPMEADTDTPFTPLAPEAQLIEPGLVELTSLDGRRIGLIIDELTVIVHAGRMTISEGQFDLLLRSEDWLPSGE
ncbi:MAG: DUF4153 domain-containing protein [Inquilinaceae bacterium]